MKTETDTYIQWKQEHYDQDVIKSYSSYICHTPAIENNQTNSIPPFPTESLPALQQFFHSPSFLGFLVSSIPPPLLKGGGRGFELRICIGLRPYVENTQI